MVPMKLSPWWPLALSGLLACELPQDKNQDASTQETVSTGTSQSFKMLYLVDGSTTQEGDTPGADIDALVVFREKLFLFAGCAEVSLFGEAAAHQDKPAVDADQGTLAIREAAEGSGFVSLAGGTLTCELPLAIQTGDVLQLWEIEADGKELVKVSLAEAPGAPATTAAGELTGTAELQVP
jgi:hypothetical protein